MIRLIHKNPLYRLASPIALAITSKTNRTNLRCVCTRLHIKGLPSSLNLHEIYQFVSDYGPVSEMAVYSEVQESSPTSPELGQPVHSPYPERKKKIVYHNRPAGQTAIVTFRSTNSAIACKEELHWRPFPWNSRSIVQMPLKNDTLSNIITRDDIISRLPRDRPLLNVHFETNFMYQRLRGWVKRDLDLSKTKVSEWEKTNLSLNR